MENTFTDGAVSDSEVATSEERERIIQLFAKKLSPDLVAAELGIPRSTLDYRLKFVHNLFPECEKVWNLRQWRPTLVKGTEQ
ncbi:MAG TPA: helix-turn-helix domain-containing protein [Fibrella sp.]